MDEERRLVLGGCDEPASCSAQSSCQGQARQASRQRMHGLDAGSVSVSAVVRMSTIADPSSCTHMQQICSSTDSLQHTCVERLLALPAGPGSSAASGCGPGSASGCVDGGADLRPDGRLALMAAAAAGGSASAERFLVLPAAPAQAGTVCQGAGKLHNYDKAPT